MDGNLTPPPSQKQHNENSINVPPESKESEELSALLHQQSGEDFEGFEDPPATLTSASRGETAGLSSGGPDDSPESARLGTPKQKNADECYVCKDATGITISCCDCKRNLCFLCTGLNETQFVIYKCTKRKFSCDTCATKLIDENPLYEDIRREIRAYKKQEKKPEKFLVECGTQTHNDQCQKESECQTPVPTTVTSESQTLPPLASGTVASESQTPPPPVENIEDTPTPKKLHNKQEKQEKKDIICKFYRNGNCRKSLNGIACPYRHPRACRYELKHGPRGCKWGNNCKYLHPHFCRDSITNYQCLNLECTSYHIKGTRRYTTEEHPEKLYHNQKNVSEWHAQPNQPNRADIMEENIKNLQNNVMKMMNMMRTMENYQKNFPLLPSMAHHRAPQQHAFHMPMQPPMQPPMPLPMQPQAR